MADRQVSIRMYRQGLGDCFLLTFPGKQRPFRMLIDCGALNSKRYDSTLMKRVVADIVETTGGRVDVVAGTHEHWDHVSGFLQAAEELAGLEVEDVWVAWTEDPDSAAARRLKQELAGRRRAVERALARMPEDGVGRQPALYRKAIGELFEFFGGLGAAQGGLTERAWKAMLALGANVYCDPAKAPMTFQGVDDVRVYVLGPPEDLDLVRKRDSAKETYQQGERGFSLVDGLLAALDPGSVEPELLRRAQPFDEHHRVSPDEARRSSFFTERYGFDAAGGPAWRRIDSDWLDVAGELALHLDSYTNNACLALAIELLPSGKVLLFPGDAQVGNWLSWGDRSWTVKDPDGSTRRVTIDDLLARTVLYKVGHHGSHNATLRANGLEKMQHPELVAMIPVHRATAADQEWEFPFKPLLKRLKEKARHRVLLADAKGIEEIEAEASARLPPRDWASFKKRTSFEELYIEHRIPF